MLAIGGGGGGGGEPEFLQECIIEVLLCTYVKVDTFGKVQVCLWSPLYYTIGHFVIR